jgi:hypothetical protein
MVSAVGQAPLLAPHWTPLRRYSIPTAMRLSSSAPRARPHGRQQSECLWRNDPGSVSNLPLIASVLPRSTAALWERRTAMVLHTASGLIVLASCIQVHGTAHFDSAIRRSKTEGPAGRQYRSMHAIGAFPHTAFAVRKDGKHNGKDGSYIRFSRPLLHFEFV